MTSRSGLLVGGRVATFCITRLHRFTLGGGQLCRNHHLKESKTRKAQRRHEWSKVVQRQHDGGEGEWEAEAGRRSRLDLRHAAVHHYSAGRFEVELTEMVKQL